MPSYTSNKYSHTPRKVFDKLVDRIEIRRQRDREDHRNDVQALIARIANLEERFQNQFPVEEKHGCRDSTCKFCSDEAEPQSYP